jgi:hypothetical protein
MTTIGPATRAIIKQVARQGMIGVSYTEQAAFAQKFRFKKGDRRIEARGFLPFRASDVSLMTQAELDLSTSADYLALIQKARANDAFAATLLRLCSAQVPIFNTVKDAGTILRTEIEIPASRRTIRMNFLILRNRPEVRAILSFLGIEFSETKDNIAIAKYVDNFEKIGNARENGKLFVPDCDFSCAPVGRESAVSVFGLAIPSLSDLDQTPPHWPSISTQLRDQLQAKLLENGIHWFLKSPFGPGNGGPYFDVVDWSSQIECGDLNMKQGGTVLQVVGPL